ncbi:MAG: TRAP transporter substrate-binding protein [Firmicutes bacterium]|nr:TRAP transporter substrate-binding protein [Bacillota bacterium]
MKKLVSILLVLAMIFSMAACSSSNDGGDATSDEGGVREMTITVGGTVAEDHPLSLALAKFEEEVEAASDGKMQVECHVNGALGAGRELVESLMLGNLQVCEVTTSAFAGWTGEYSLLGIPYTIPSRDVAYALWDSEVGDKMRENILDITGVRTLAFWENGVRHITNNIRPITKAEDMKGIKIRVMENDVYIKMMELLGALPTPMSVTELYTALQTNSVDAQENPWVNTLTYGFADVQKYVSNSSHTFDATSFNVNNEWYESLTADEKKIIDDAAAVATKYQREKAIELDEASLETLKEKGMEYYEMSDAELQTFRDALVPIQDWFVNESGISTVTDLQTVLDKIAELSK